MQVGVNVERLGPSFAGAKFPPCAINQARQLNNYQPISIGDAVLVSLIAQSAATLDYNRAIMSLVNRIFINAFLLQIQK